jgi:hypothetical protein
MSPVEDSMMKTGVALVMLLLLATTPGLAMSVNLDYDKDYDFSKIRTYQWIAPTTIDRDPLIRQRITNAVKYQLGTRGLREVESDPDIYVTFNSNAREDVSMNTTDIAPAGWREHTNYGTATTSMKTYRVGTLIVNATDAKTKKLVWSGIAEDTVKPDPDKIEKKINQALEKMAKLWDSLKTQSSPGSD